VRKIQEQIEGKGTTRTNAKEINCRNKGKGKEWHEQIKEKERNYRNKWKGQELQEQIEYN
jgi:hypothetical protein